MSLSKVHKQSKDFKPEKLIHNGKEQSPDWQPARVDTDQAALDRPSGVPPTQAVSNHPIEPSGDEFASHATASPEQQTVPPTSEPEHYSGNEQNIAAPQPEPSIPVEPAIDIEAIKTEAYQAGLHAGMAQVESDFGSALAALMQISDQLNSLRETILKNSKSELIELVVILAEKIIRHSVSNQNDTIIKTIEEALSRAVKSSDFYIFVNPSDLETVKSKSAEFIAGLNGLENITIKSDPSVEQGGCKIESENCTVDATIVSQLEIIKEEIDKEIS
ncbi:MAG: hypothetical protein D6B25_16590 [Desulfobulbaceae bacterium]|nr:MAG: hypothetical protein D6B25_16590 [Desulfobulbaceae bacterium]